MKQRINPQFKYCCKIKQFKKSNNVSSVLHYLFKEKKLKKPKPIHNISIQSNNHTANKLNIRTPKLMAIGKSKQTDLIPIEPQEHLLLNSTSQHAKQNTEEQTPKSADQLNNKQIL